MLVSPWGCPHLFVGFHANGHTLTYFTYWYIYWLFWWIETFMSNNFSDEQDLQRSLSRYDNGYKQKFSKAFFVMARTHFIEYSQKTPHNSHVMSCLLQVCSSPCMPYMSRCRWWCQWLQKNECHFNYLQSRSVFVAIFVTGMTPLSWSVQWSQFFTLLLRPLLPTNLNLSMDQ